MNLWLELKYAKLISSNLTGYKIKKSNPFLANFRCIFCGDSNTNKNKARGYIYENKGSLRMKCHNCGYTCRFESFLKKVDTSLYQQYCVEKIKEKGETKSVIVAEKFSMPQFQQYEALKGLKKISQLPDSHGAKKYVLTRGIPSKSHFRLYYSPKFYRWANEVVPNSFSEKALEHDEPRLVIPFIDRQGTVYGFTGRSFSKNASLRYITIMIDKSKPKVFGIDQIDYGKPVKLVEGPLDSLFLDNALAMAGSDVNLDSIDQKNNLIIIPDREPRNKEICKIIERRIKNGYKVCLMPDTMVGKDINDYILSGYTTDQIEEIIKNNTFSGLRAELEFSKWKK